MRTIRILALLLLALVPATTCSADFAYRFKVDGKAVSLTATTKSWTLTFAEEKVSNLGSEETHRFSGGYYGHYRSDVKVLFVGKTTKDNINDEVQVRILPTNSRKLTGDSVLIGGKKVVRQQGNTETTFQFGYRIQTSDRIYEIWVDEVESKTPPKFFTDAVRTFKEVKVR